MEPPDTTAEALRIQAAYARREREIAPDLYSWGNAGNLFGFQQLQKAVIEMLVKYAQFPLWGWRIADTGCGSGRWLMEFAQWGVAAADLCGIEINPDRVQNARRRLAGADIREGDAREMPWPDASFDMVTQFTLFTSILNSGIRQAVAAEMLRVLKPDGVILWYDFRVNNPRNPDVRGIEVAEIRELFPDCDVHLRRVTLAPPIARRLVPVSWTLGLWLEKLPLLRTHYVGIIRKPA